MFVLQVSITVQPLLDKHATFQGKIYFFNSFLPPIKNTSIKSNKADKKKKKIGPIKYKIRDLAAFGMLLTEFWLNFGCILAAFLLHFAVAAFDLSIEKNLQKCPRLTKWKSYATHQLFTFLKFSPKKYQKSFFTQQKRCQGGILWKAFMIYLLFEKLNNLTNSWWVKRGQLLPCNPPSSNSVDRIFFLSRNLCCGIACSRQCCWDQESGTWPSWS